MKKIFCLFLSVFTMFMLISCDNENNTNNTQNGNNTNNTQEEIDIKIVGSYDNFEALEAEFTKFNEAYPNVRLTYKKLDDYDNTIISVLEGNSKPNIFFSTNCATTFGIPPSTQYSRNCSEYIFSSSSVKGSVLSILSKIRMTLSASYPFAHRYSSKSIERI